MLFFPDITPLQNLTADAVGHLEITRLKIIRLTNRCIQVTYENHIRICGCSTEIKM